MRQGTNHGSATVITESPERKVRVGRPLYLAVRGRLIERDSHVQRWAEGHGYSRQRVEDALYGKSNSDEAKSIRADLARELSLEIEEG